MINRRSHLGLRPVCGEARLRRQQIGRFSRCRSNKFERGLGRDCVEDLADHLGPIGIDSNLAARLLTANHLIGMPWVYLVGIGDGAQYRVFDLE